MSEPTTPVLPDLSGDVVDLALALVSIPSVSGAEAPLADAVQKAPKIGRASCRERV